MNEEYEKAVPSIKWELISGQISRQLDVKVTEDDLLKYATHLAARQFAQYGMTNIDEDMLSGYAKNMINDKNSRRYIIEAVTNANLFEAIGNAVTIEDHTVSLDQFKAEAEKISGSVNGHIIQNHKRRRDMQVKQVPAPFFSGIIKCFVHLHKS